MSVPAPAPSVAESGRFASSGKAISRSVGFTPDLASDRAGWSSLGLYVWHGRCGEARFEAFSEPVIIYHVGGAPSVSVRVARRRWDGCTHPGRVTIIPPETRVSWGIHGEVNSRSLHLGSRFFSASEAPLTPGLRFMCGVQDPLIATAIDSLEQEIRQPAQCGSLYADSVSDTLALHLLRQARSPGLPPAAKGGLPRAVLDRCLELLEASIEHGVSLQTLADAAGLSRAHFASAFRRSTGLSPHRHLTARRLARARELLHQAGLPLSEIALRCGFSSQAHFCDAFRRDTGLTPREYRNGH